MRAAIFVALCCACSGTQSNRQPPPPPALPQQATGETREEPEPTEPIFVPEPSERVSPPDDEITHRMRGELWARKQIEKSKCEARRIAERAEAEQLKHLHGVERTRYLEAQRQRRERRGNLGECEREDRDSDAEVEPGQLDGEAR